MKIQMELKLEKWREKLIRHKLQVNNDTGHGKGKNKVTTTAMTKGTFSLRPINQFTTEFIATFAKNMLAISEYFLDSRVEKEALAWGEAA